MKLLSGARRRLRPAAKPDQNALGRRAEDAAAHWLQRRGARILQRNHRCRQGEIDIVALHENVLLFVEVRLRTSGAWGGAAASVHRGKQKRIICAAQHFLQTVRGGADHPCRFDVAVAARDARGEIQITDWIRDAFAA